MLEILPLVAAKAGPMEALRTLLSASSVDDPDKDSNSPEANQRKAVRLVAQMPVLVASFQAARTGGVVPEADPSLGTAGNFLLQITGKTPSTADAAAFDECLVLHADHTMNASTFAARVCAATLSDMHSAVTAAIGTLKGSLHGGANEQVMKTLESIADGVAGVDAAVSERLDRGRKADGLRPPGLPHRGPAGHSPAPPVRSSSARPAATRTYYDMSIAMEQTVMRVKGLYPNVDFFAASVYHALGIPTDLFTPVFAISRMSGWTAHVIEQHADNRLIRPDSEYIGLTGPAVGPDRRPVTARQAVPEGPVRRPLGELPTAVVLFIAASASWR